MGNEDLQVKSDEERAREIAEHAGIDMLDDHDLFIAEMSAALTAVRAEASAATEAMREALIEATAELIYLRQYGKEGAVWWANHSKDVWRDKARAALGLSK